MGKFMKGDIVVIPFPFSDLSSNKRRPALVLSDLTGNDVILCQITSKDICDQYAIPLTIADFVEGSLNQVSNIRPNRLFTADESIILYKAGKVNKTKYTETVKSLTLIIS